MRGALPSSLTKPGSIMKRAGRRWNHHWPDRVGLPVLWRPVMQPAERRVEIVTPPLSHTGSARPEASVTFTWTADDFVALAKQAPVHAAAIVAKAGQISTKAKTGSSVWGPIYFLLGLLLVGMLFFFTRMKES